MNRKFLIVACCALAFLSCVATFAADSQAKDPTKEVGSTPGERGVVVVDGVEFAFRWAPAGSFLMGSAEDEEERDQYEYQHEVTLTKGFWILETEATQQMWTTLCGSNPSKWVGEKRPVDTVGIADVVEFCAKFAEKVDAKNAGITIQLPTEAQWEYAARAGSNEPYGGKSLDEVGWFGDEDYGGTHDVATKAPNAWGVYDMCGNLWEWCADRFADYPRDSEGKGVAQTDPTGATPEECPGDIRVDRGGCWDSAPRECRNAYRGFYDGDRKGPYVGFRFTIVR